MDFVGSNKIGRIPDLDLFSTPSYNKCLALPTVGIVSATISSKTGFVGDMPLREARCAMPMTALMLG